MNMPFGAPSPPSPSSPASGDAAGARCPSPRSTALHIGIACSAETVLHEDNWRLLEAFTGAGHEARIVIWNDPSIRAWSAFDCVVVRTCWTLDVSTRDALLSWLRRVNEVCNCPLSSSSTKTRFPFILTFFVSVCNAFQKHKHKQETVLVNPYEVISWNTEHPFLDELYARGVNVVPSVLVPQHEQPDAVLAAMEQRGWTEALVRPAILPEEVMQVFVAAAPSRASPVHSPLASTATASSSPPTGPQQQHQKSATAATAAAAEEQHASVAVSAVAAALSHDAQRNLWLKRVTELRQQVGDVLVRPFVRPVLREGETSFVFVDGMFSHAVRRRPRADDFHATQVLTLPFVEPHVPSDDALFFAISAYTALAATVRDLFGRGVAPVFARIDVVRDAAGTLLVNSVELVDPVLFFSRSPTAAKTFVAAVVSFVHSRRPRLASQQQQSHCTTQPSSSSSSPVLPTAAVSFFPPIANIGAH